MSTVLFVGVSTAGSLIHRAFPRWAALLGVDAEIVGVDLPAGAEPAAYRGLVRRVRADPSCLGAVVTAHKVRLYEAAAGEFDVLEPAARSCGEINAIRHRGGVLTGFARDPVSVGRVVDAIWPVTAGGDVLCLGAGGTAIALGRHLLGRREPPELCFADRAPDAVDRLVRTLGGDRVSVRHGDGPWDDAIAAMPSGSLVVNATGMGKDRPGCPVTEAVTFPDRSVVWELNYRGDLRMLGLARAQAGAGRALAVHDGWSLFCHGWAAALSAVLDRPDDGHLAGRFAEAASDLATRR